MPAAQWAEHIFKYHFEDQHVSRLLRFAQLTMPGCQRWASAAAPASPWVSSPESREKPISDTLNLLPSQLTVPGLWTLGLGCGVGLAMNFFSWKLREAVSATTVTVIGNICKFITILANMLIWDQHSGEWGLASSH